MSINFKRLKYYKEFSVNMLELTHKLVTKKYLEIFSNGSKRCVHTQTQPTWECCWCRVALVGGEQHSGSWLASWSGAGLSSVARLSRLGQLSQVICRSSLRNWWQAGMVDGSRGLTEEAGRPWRSGRKR